MLAFKLLIAAVFAATCNALALADNGSASVQYCYFIN